MHRLRALGRGRRVLLALGVAGAVFAIATAVQAAIPDSNGVIHGCYSKPSTPTRGELRVRDTGVGELCKSTELPLDWKTNGATGKTGPKGTTGPTGRAGPTGPAGPGGPADAYTSYGGGPFVNIAVGDSANVATVTLPVGHYVLWGNVNMWGGFVTDDPSDVHCFFTTLGDIHQRIDDFEAGKLTDSVFLVQAPLLADVNITVANTVVNLTCSTQNLSGYGPARIQNASMIAIPVANVISSP